jgi:hypothetical protein
MGIEPTSEAWEASILPLYDARSGVIVPAKWAPGKRCKRQAKARMKADESCGAAPENASLIAYFVQIPPNERVSDCAAVARSIVDPPRVVL